MTEYVAVLLGRRGGRLQRHGPTTGSAPAPTSSRSGDYNRDGRKDLAVTVFELWVTSWSSTVGATGRFGGKRSFPGRRWGLPDPRPRPRPGRADRPARRQLHERRRGRPEGQARGLQGRREQFSPSRQPYFLNLTDADLDGKRDLVSVNTETGDGSDGLAVQEGAAEDRGSARAPVYFSTGATPFAIASGRFNRDREPDIVVSDSALGADTASFFPQPALRTVSVSEPDQVLGLDPRVTPRKSMISCEEETSCRSRSRGGR